MSQKFTNLHVGSLNCRSLIKTTQQSVSSQFIRHFRQEKFDLLTLQETHASSSEVISSLDISFQNTQSFWTPHCGILNFNPNLSLKHIFSSDDGRLIHCSVSSLNHLFPTFDLVTIYAPASTLPRRQFYFDIQQLPLFSSPTQPLMLTGDFNYHPSVIRFTDSPLSVNNAQHKWHSSLLESFVECAHPSLDSPISTFRRGHSSTTLDYFFVSRDLHASFASSRVDYVNPKWTDHALLALKFRFGSVKHGPGLWRGNPLLTTNPYFLKAFSRVLYDFYITRLVHYFPLDFEEFDHLCIRHQNTWHYTPVLPFLGGNAPPQQLWEDLKTELKRLMKSFGRQQASLRTKKLEHLQRKRDKLIRTVQPSQPVHPLLPSVEAEIATLQSELVEIQALKARKHWRENGETSAGYLERTIDKSRAQKFISVLQHPTNPSLLCQTPDQLEDAVTCFYQELFQAEPIDLNKVDSLLESIPEGFNSQSEHRTLLKPITLDEIRAALKRCPSKSAPGMDGLPYQILQLIAHNKLLAPLFVTVYNEALFQQRLPISWTDTCMTLLPKKGDLTSLSNWRPISLINTDAKTFTRILNSRLMLSLNHKISSHQMGFM